MKNYALIAEGFNTIFVKAYKDKNKKVIKEGLTKLKENKELKALYVIVDNLKNGDINVESVDEFIDYNISESKKYNFSKLDKLIPTEKQQPSNEVISSIGVILFENKSIYNVTKWEKAYNVVKSNLLAESNWVNKVSQASKKLHPIYENLDKQDKTLVENFSKKAHNKKELFTENQKNCVELLKSHIETVDDPKLKLKMFEAKEKIQDMDYNEKSFIQDILKIHNLKKNL